MTRERMLAEYQQAINAFSRQNPKLVAKLRTTLAQLELVSHTSAVNYGGDRVAGTEGPDRPPGGDEERGAHGEERLELLESFYSKTLDHYRWRVVHCKDLEELEAIQVEADETVGKWRLKETPSEPEFGSPLWKRWVAESKLSVEDISRRSGASRKYVYEIRAKYTLDG